MNNDETQWYFNPEDGTVAQGHELPWEKRMGPYATEQEAHEALQRAAQRNEAADAQDEADNEWGVPPKWDTKD